MHPQFASYTVSMNVEKRKAMRMMLDVSASFAKGYAWLPQMAFYFGPGRRNRVWDTLCDFVADTGEKENTGEATDVSDAMYREVEI